MISYEMLVIFRGFCHDRGLAKARGPGARDP